MKKSLIFAFIASISACAYAMEGENKRPAEGLLEENSATKRARTLTIEVVQGLLSNFQQGIQSTAQGEFDKLSSKIGGFEQRLGVVEEKVRPMLLAVQQRAAVAQQNQPSISPQQVQTVQRTVSALQIQVPAAQRTAVQHIPVVTTTPALKDRLHNQLRQELNRISSLSSKQERKQAFNQLHTRVENLSNRELKRQSLLKMEEWLDEQHDQVSSSDKEEDKEEDELSAIKRFIEQEIARCEQLKNMKSNKREKSAEPKKKKRKRKQDSDDEAYEPNFGYKENDQWFGLQEVLQRSVEEK